MQTIAIQGRKLELMRYPSAQPRVGVPAIVFLHEGLGCAAMWRDFPQRVADASGCEAVVYSRYGHGRSDPLQGPRDVRYLHDEALAVLPELLDRLAIHRPILFGHSDGASIALIHAGGCSRPVAAVIAMAPHVLVEEIALDGIAATVRAYESTDLARRLERHHADAGAMFRGWSDVWQHPNFRNWNIEKYVSSIQVPILAIQGEEDEYATMDQLDRIANLATDVELVRLADCRHSPQKDQPEAVIAAASVFIARILAN